MEIKEEIKQIIDVLPDDVLGELLQYLRQIELEPKEKIRLSSNLNTILVEDSELLERLAQ